MSSSTAETPAALRKSIIEPAVSTNHPTVWNCGEMTVSGQWYKNNAKKNRIIMLVHDGNPRSAIGIATVYQTATTQAFVSREKEERLNANNNSEAHTDTAKAMTP
jgi:hypothetical protein